MKKSIIVLVVIIVIVSCRTVFPVTTEQVRIPQSDDLVERGRILTLSACGPCHLNSTTNSFIGERMYDMPRILGKFYASNLTQDTTHGIARYSDAEIAYLVKTGINREGRYIPFMLRPNIADEDLEAIIAFLRSDNPEVHASDSVVGNSTYSFIGKLGFTIVNNKPMPYRTGIIKPPADSTLSNGKYLVDILGCFHCHSSSLSRINYLHPEQTKGYMQGGLKMRGADGDRFRASNLTPDFATGIGTYSAAEFARAVKTGIAKNDKVLRYPMRIYSDLPDDQVQAIYSYLMTLNPVYHKTGR